MTTTTTDRPPTAADLLTRDGWSRERLERHCGDALAALLRHAVARSPYYREVLGAAPWERPFQELPVLTKATLMARWDDVVTVPALRLAAVEERLADPGYDGTVASGIRACTTSGSSGRRGVFVFGEDELATWVAAMLRALAYLGVAPGMRTCGLGSVSPTHMSRHLFAALEGVPVTQPPVVSALTPLPDLVRHVQAAQPEVLLGYTSVIAALADEQLRGRLDIAPRAIGTTSEVLADDHRERIRAAWSVEAREAYPTTEVPVIAGCAQDGPDLLVADDLVIVEAVDAEGGPVPFGAPGHRLLVTNLVNRTQPLIRYELADAVTLAPPSGARPWTRITRIEGRTADVLDLPAAGGGTVRVHPHRLRRAFTALPEVGAYQLRVSPTGITARIVPDPAHAGGTAAVAVQQALRAELRQAGAVVAVTVELADEIARDPAKGGKLAAVVVES